MDRFKELTTFVEVAQRGSLSAAAREEGITPAMVGRRIDQLEERLGVKLFKRSTRKVTLTPEGATFYEDCHRVLTDLRSAEDSLTAGAKSAAGRLIVTAPTAFGRKHIAPHLPGFLATHPNLSIQLHLSERLVDLKNERFDLAIRIADLKSADLVAVKLARNHRCLCASPGYLKRAGKPRALADLAHHNCLVTSTEDGVADSWHFQDKGKAVTVKVGGKNQIYFCPDGSAQDSAGGVGQCSGNMNNGVVYIARPAELMSSRAITIWGATGRIRGWRIYNNGGVAWQRQ